MATSAIARQINEARVLQTLFEHGPMSRATLARHLDLTKSTMTNVIGDLVTHRLIQEIESVERPVRVGRPGTAVDLDPDGAHFLGAEVGVAQVRVLALDLKGRVVGGRALVEDHAERTVEAAFAHLADLVGRYLRQALPRDASIQGLCVSFPGFINRAGTIVRAPLLGWRDVPALALLRRRFGVPVAVENDANLSAFAEWYLSPVSHRHDLLMIALSAGAGAGLISEGRILRGANGLAGEVGHIVLDEQRHGGFESRPMAWEEAIGTGALLGAYARRAGRTVDLDAFRAALDEADPAAVVVTRVWARWLARGFLALTYVHDPERIVVGGELAAVFGAVRDQTAAEMQRTLIPGFPAPSLHVSTLGPDIGAIGAAAMVHSAFLRGSPLA